MSALSTWRGYAPGLIAVTLLAWASVELHTLPQLAAATAPIVLIKALRDDPEVGMAFPPLA